MTDRPTDPNRTDTGRTTWRRVLGATAGAVVLFAGGAWLYNAGIFGPLLQPAAQRIDTGAERAAQNAEARRAWLEARQAKTADPAAATPSWPTDAEGYFVPNRVEDAPDTPFGDSVRRGHELFTNTQTAAADYVGNGLNCVNCHLGAGTKPHAAPMYAAAGEYPAFRGKNQRINTMEDRVHGCFTYSMNAQSSANGGPPEAGHQIYKDIESYFYFLAEGAPLEGNLPGRSYPVPPKPEDGWDVAAGETVYEENCAVCHGTDGEGRQDINGRWIFPALWGDNSFNWGAGMHRVNTAAGFIKANMPLGHGYSLTDEEAWDVAAFVNSHERPPDPRQIRDGLSVAETDARFHQHQSLYGEVIRGDLLGDNVLGSPEEQPPRVPRVSRQEAAAE
ncbi:c-type cytochrome [Rhodosalinus sediminis]|uniref:c-type cytochrome n=1 Tax=Rhodosalinus sediminis TaxID=1940533 RepID=UPI0023543447|nr:c-type cytochrome [Rhodosalinus sediminis]